MEGEEQFKRYCHTREYVIAEVPHYIYIQTGMFISGYCLFFDQLIEVEFQQANRLSFLLKARTLAIDVEADVPELMT